MMTGSEHITRGVDVRGAGAWGYYGSSRLPRGPLRGQHEAAARRMLARGQTKGRGIHEASARRVERGAKLGVSSWRG